MPDLTAIIQASAAHAWLYLPVAVVLGALHALEPGHAKSLMAAYIISIRGSAKQAAALGVSAAIGHTIIVWALAVTGLLFGEKLIVEQAEPWLTLISGILVVLLACRMFLRLKWGHSHSHEHDHAHGHTHDRGHAHDHSVSSQTASPIGYGDIVWFGFTGGLLPCPSAVAVLLVCIQIKQFTLGLMMIAAFSVGLAATLVAVGVAASWGAQKAAERWAWFDKAAHRIPYISAGFVLLIGLVMTAVGLNGTDLLRHQKSP